MATSLRIVSLLPSSTEIVYALGLADCLVGISHACDYPPEITHRPRLSRPKIDLPATSPSRAQVAYTPRRQGVSFDQIDTELLQALQPDLIITQDQGDVCVVPYAEVMAAVRHMPGRQAEVLAVRPTLLQDIWDNIDRIGAATGHRPQAQTLLQSLFTRINALVAESMMIRQPPRVAVLAGIEPLRLAGYWVPELIQIAGGSAGLCRPGQPSPTVEWQALRDYAPEVLAVMPRGYPLAQTLSALPALQRLPGWEALPAVRQGQVYAVAGNTYVNRPGPRIVESLEILAGLIHPELFGADLPEDGSVYRRVG